jgi:uncharacterized protein
MLDAFFDWLVYSFLALGRGSPAAEAAYFFAYDSVKILALLFSMIAVIGFFRSYVPPGRIRSWLSGRRAWVSYLAAASFGALTPFCSCSSIPIFISLMKAGVPLGPAFAFLVTSPLINEYLAVLMLGFFGWKITLAYIFFGMLLGMVSGFFIERMNMKGQLVEGLVVEGESFKDPVFPGFRSRIAYGLSEAVSMTKSLWLWVLFGVGVGAFIHGFIPKELIDSAVGATGLFAVPIVVLIGIPLYANCSAVVPIAVVLFQKGVPIGTALAFMMATSALSLPEAIILRRAMKVRLILMFFGIVGAGIVVIGYVFNALQGVL